jgi:hypothetical protein
MPIKLLKESSETGEIINEVENFLAEKGVYIYVPLGNSKLMINIKGVDYSILEDTGEAGTQFPRRFDEDRLMLRES